MLQQRSAYSRDANQVKRTQSNTHPAHALKSPVVLGKQVFCDTHLIKREEATGFGRIL